MNKTTQAKVRRPTILLCWYFGFVIVISLGILATYGFILILNSLDNSPTDHMLYLRVLATEIPFGVFELLSTMLLVTKKKVVLLDSGRTWKGLNLSLATLTCLWPFVAPGFHIPPSAVAKGVGFFLEAGILNLALLLIWHAVELRLSGVYVPVVYKSIVSEAGRYLVCLENGGLRLLFARVSKSDFERFRQSVNGVYDPDLKIREGELLQMANDSCGIILVKAAIDKLRGRS